MQRVNSAKVPIRYSNIGIYCLIGMLCAYSYDSFAATVTFQSFAGNLKETFRMVKEIMTMAAYTCGIGFSIMGLAKFKAYKDNPAQIPISTPIVLITVSAALLFLPTVFEIAGDGIFGSDATSGARYLDKSYTIA